MVPDEGIESRCPGADQDPVERQVNGIRNSVSELRVCFEASTKPRPGFCILKAGLLFKTPKRPESQLRNPEFPVKSIEKLP